MPNKPDEISPLPPLSEIGRYGDRGEKLLPVVLSKLMKNFHLPSHKKENQPASEQAQAFAPTGKERILLVLAEEICAVFKKI